MDAQLVGSSGHGPEVDARPVALVRHDAVARPGGLAVLVVDDLAGAVQDALPQREVEVALLAHLPHPALQ